MPLTEKKNQKQYSGPNYNNDNKNSSLFYNSSSYSKHENGNSDERGSGEYCHQRSFYKAEGGNIRNRSRYYNNINGGMYYDQYTEKHNKSENKYEERHKRKYDHDKEETYSRRENQQYFKQKPKKYGEKKYGENKHGETRCDDSRHDSWHDNYYENRNSFRVPNENYEDNTHLDTKRIGKDVNNEFGDNRYKERYREGRYRERSERYNLTKRDSRKESVSRRGSKSRNFSINKEGRREYTGMYEKDDHYSFSTGKYDRKEKNELYRMQGKQEHREGSRKRVREVYTDEDKSYSMNEHERYAKKSAAEILEKKNNIELSRFIFLYKIPDDITEEEIDEIIRNIAIKEAFSLPNAIYINKISYFTIKDDLFLKENLEYLKNNSYFNCIQQNRLKKNKEGQINDDNCCIIEFPCEEASTKLYSLFEKEQTMEIKNTVCYIFPLFKLIKKRNKIINEDNRVKKIYMDWYCSFCNFFNFSKRTTCHFCKAAQTEDAKIVENEAVETTNFMNMNVGVTENSYYQMDIGKEIYNASALGRSEQNSFNAVSPDHYKQGYMNNYHTDNFVKGMDHINRAHTSCKGTNDSNTSSNVISNTNSDIYTKGVDSSSRMLYHYPTNSYAMYNNRNVNPSTVNGAVYNLQKIKNELCEEEKTEMLIVKGIDGNYNDKKIMNFFETLFKKTDVECCYLFNDIKGSNKKRGFCFIQFINCATAEKVMADFKGNYYINFQNNNLKIDYVNVKEKEAFFKCIDLAKLNINASSATVYDNHFSYFNFFVSYLEIPLITTNMFYYYCFLKWTFQIIIWKTGKPQLNEFFYDPTSSYYYHPVYQLYFDDKTKFYMSLATGYYIWNDQTELLVRVYPEDYVNTSNNMHTNNQGNTNYGSVQTDIMNNQTNNENNINNKETGSINRTEQNATTEKESTNTKISLFVKNVKKVALASKKTKEQMNLNEIILGKKKTEIEKHFNTDSDEESENEKQKENHQKEKEKEKEERKKQAGGEEKPYQPSGGVSNFEKINKNFSKNEDNVFDTIHSKNEKKSELKKNTSNINKDDEDNIHLICFICLRKFINAEMLRRHIAYSQLHKKNLQID